MKIDNSDRSEKLTKFHLVLCGAGAGSIVSRLLEDLNGGYSLPVQLTCMSVGLVAAHLAVKRYYRAKPRSSPVVP